MVPETQGKTVLYSAIPRLYGEQCRLYAQSHRGGIAVFPVFQAVNIAGGTLGTVVCPVFYAIHPLFLRV